MNQAQTIIEALGGINATAKIAVVSVQAVYQWRDAGVIPPRSLKLLQRLKPKVFRDLAAPKQADEAA